MKEITYCPNCGTELTSNFCYNCGWKGSSGNNTQLNTHIDNNYKTDDGFLGNNRLSHANGMSATVTATDWFKLFGISWLIMLIPIVGSIGSLVYYILLLCKNTTAPSIKGYLKFSLIVAAIAFVLGIVAAILFFAFAWNKTAVLPADTSKISSLFEYAPV